ncbi:MAG: hypothetical protein HQ517_08920 [SAR324 cluster bacterium]|nr:hypothetical protein [SAR324 cluster bacterium]
MITVQQGIRSEQVRFQGQHVLFVEGSEESFDINTLNQLFEAGVKIEPLGASYSLTDVAKSLFKFHPTYYFLIDRDHHHDDSYIEECWKSFPDPAKHNLLVWKRREIENYFLEPAYLFQSKYCQVSEEKVAEKVLVWSNERLFLDVSNRVITSIREELKRNWIQIFTNPAEFNSKESALNKLKSASEFEAHRANVAQTVSQNEVENRFYSFLNQMTGGKDKLEFGTGNWLAMIQGEKVLPQVIHSGCFQVLDIHGSQVTGREKLNEVVKDLLQKEASVQPEDFITLKTMIGQRLQEVV